jgi:hypothetical protein
MTSADFISASGSGREPAHYNGCFSIRPSIGIMNTEGVICQFVCVLLHWNQPQQKSNDFSQEV